MIYLFAKLNMPSSSNSSVIAITPRTKDNILMAVTMIFYVLQKCYLNKTYVLFRYVLYISIENHKSEALVSLIAGN
jgi:hypothetical protein